MPAAKSSVIAAQLEDEILRSGLRPGWRLPSEEQLCATYGASRTAVREAIQQLKARSLVTSRRGGGTYVAGLDDATVSRAVRVYSRLAVGDHAYADLLDFRIQIEAANARAVAQRRDKDSLARLKAVLDTMRRTQAEPEGFAEADFEFHRVLAAESGNRLHAGIIRALADTLSREEKVNHRLPADRERVMGDHEAIYEALRTGNGAAAAALIASHLRPAGRPA